MGGAAAGAGGQAGVRCEWRQRRRHKEPPQGVRRQGHHFEVRDSGEDSLHRQYSQDQRLQDQQEGAARAVRWHVAVRTQREKSRRKTWATSPLSAWAKVLDRNSVFPIGSRSISHASTRLRPAPAIANGSTSTSKGRGGKVRSEVRSLMAI